MANTTVDIPSPVTARKFLVACIYAAVVAVLNLVVTFSNANPAYAAYGSIALAFLGAINVWYVRNKMYVDITGDPVDLLNQRIDSLQILLPGLVRTGDTWAPVTPSTDTTGQSSADDASVVAPTSDEDVGTGRTADSERAY